MSLLLKVLRVHTHQHYTITVLNVAFSVFEWPVPKSRGGPFSKYDTHSRVLGLFSDDTNVFNSCGNSDHLYLHCHKLSLLRLDSHASSSSPSSQVGFPHLFPLGLCLHTTPHYNYPSRPLPIHVYSSLMALPCPRLLIVGYFKSHPLYQLLQNNQNHVNLELNSSSC